MTINPFNGVEPTAIIAALLRDCDSEQIVSIMFRAVVPPVRSIDSHDQWLRLKAVLGCKLIYDTLGISSLTIELRGTFNYANGLETIGTIANLLMRGGVHRKFVDDRERALTLARDFLDSAILGQYETVEAYSCRTPWCDWFIGENVLDETLLIGNRGEWWLLAVCLTSSIQMAAPRPFGFVRLAMLLRNGNYCRTTS